MNNRILKIGLHAIFWLLIEVSFVWLFNLAFSFQVAWVLVTVNVLLLILLFYIHIVAINHLLERKRIWHFVIISVLTNVGITYLRIVFSNHAVGDRIPAVILSPFQRIVSFEIFTSLIISLLAVFYQLLENRFKREQLNRILINEQQAAQLQLLKAQINPHFLFNALNNVYSLAVTKSDDAPKMLLKLSALLRYVIYESQQKTVLLSKEVEHLQQFIELFQMRSETPLAISFTTHGNLNGQSVEPMILMPIIENCFKHSDFDYNPNAFVKIEMTIDDHALTFQTRNTFNYYDTQKDDVGGVGLANIQHRLALRYGDHFMFKTAESDNIFEVTLMIRPI